MNLRKSLSRETMLPDLKADTKRGVIEEMVGFLADAGQLSDRDSALQAVLEREEKMSTGMQNGIAIPHGKTETVDRLVVAVARSRHDIDFESMDGNPARLFIMTLSPVNRTGPHMQFLAEISKVLTDETLRERLLAAGTADDMLAVLTKTQR